MAASLGQPVIASDASDERWREIMALNLAHGFRACWSTPILSSEGKVLGTFAMLSREPGSPTPQHLSTIEQVTHIASIAIERERAEEELRRSEAAVRAAKARFEGILEIAEDAIISIDSNQRIILFNQGAEKVFGYTASDVLGKPLDLLTPTRFAESHRRHIGEFSRSPDVSRSMAQRREVFGRRKDGSEFPAEASISKLNLGHDVVFTVILRDVTESKETEDRIRRSEAFLAEGQRISRTGSWGWVVSTGKVVWSEEQCRMLGFRPGEIEPSVRLFLSAVHPQDRSRVQRNLDDATREKRNYAMDYRIVLPEGSVRILRSVGRPVVAEGGSSVEEYIGVTMDITERVQAEAALRRAQRLEATGTLAGGIAHDFNNILGAILGYGEMAQRDAPEGSRLRRDLESIMSAGERGRALVDRILTFSRSGVGERVPVHVEKVVREALDLLMAKLPPNVTIKADLRAGRAAMRGDPTQIHQVVMNLATNGIQAMDAGGTLRVSLGETRFDTQQIATTGTIAGGDYIVLKIADSGSGIPPGILERIFDPFFSTKDVGVGTGLGLSLVHGIVTEVGGAINVDTKVGAGSVFTVYLPRDGEVQKGSKASNDERPELPRGDQQRILVVDDEEPLVRLATETLRELGYMPIGFTSSTDALAAFRSDPKQFDAVITDERMPGISGSALIRDIRGIRRTIPILLVSGYVGGIVEGRAYNSGATEVLKKPLSAHELATSLARVLHLQ
jgi:PAS domain S-box-containing protein